MQAGRVVDWGVGAELSGAQQLFRGTAARTAAAATGADAPHGLQQRLEPLLRQLQLPGVRRACEAVAARLRAEGSGLPAAASAVVEHMLASPPPQPLPPHLRQPPPPRCCHGANAR